MKQFSKLMLTTIITLASLLVSVSLVYIGYRCFQVDTTFHFIMGVALASLAAIQLVVTAVVAADIID